jgi:hypothetical protein
MVVKPARPGEIDAIVRNVTHYMTLPFTYALRFFAARLRESNGIRALYGKQNTWTPLSRRKYGLSVA